MAEEIKVAPAPNMGVEIPKSEEVKLEREVVAPSEAAPTVPAAKSAAQPRTQEDANTPRVNVDDEALGDTPNFDDFMKVKEGVPAAPTKPKEKKKEEIKVEVKPTETKVEVKPAAKTETTPQKTPRDYSGFEAAEVEALKRMSGEAFDYVRPRLLELKQLGTKLGERDKEIATLKSGKQILPDSYYEHPQGFVFSPEYNTASQELDLASSIRDHWQRQLVNIRKGEPYIPLTGIDPQTGRLIAGKPIESTVEDEFKINGYLQGSITQIMHKQGEINRIQREFGVRHKQAAAVVRGAIDNLFAVYKDEKHPMQPVIKSIRDNLPKEFAGTPIYDLAVYSSAAAVQWGNLYRETLAELNALKAKGGSVVTSSASAKAGPTEGDVVTSGGGKTDEVPEVTMDDFERAKRGE